MSPPHLRKKNEAESGFVGRWLVTPLQTLGIYVAAGIAAYGWSLCELLGWPSTPWLPLWFCAALVIYNADRLHRDPADFINVPLRTASARRLRGLSAVLLVSSAAVLFGLPLFRGDWLTLAAGVGGTFFVLNYSFPLLGFRFKDVPILKTFFAPTLVLFAILGLPWLHGVPVSDGPRIGLVTARAWLFLFFNMLLCDLRDRAGDQLSGIASLPVWLGEKRSRQLLIIVLVLIEILAVAALTSAPRELQTTWQLLCLGAPLYLGGLLLAVRVPRPEWFYEWAVEGMLFLPAISVAVGMGS